MKRAAEKTIEVWIFTNQEATKLLQGEGDLGSAVDSLRTGLRPTDNQLGVASDRESDHTQVAWLVELGPDRALRAVRAEARWECDGGMAMLVCLIMPGNVPSGEQEENLRCVLRVLCSEQGFVRSGIINVGLQLLQTPSEGLSQRLSALGFRPPQPSARLQSVGQTPPVCVWWARLNLQSGLHVPSETIAVP